MRFSPGCNCCGVAAECFGVCSVVPAEYSVTIAGVTDTCTGVNGTWTLPFENFGHVPGFDCYWQSDQMSSGCGVGGLWGLIIFKQTAGTPDVIQLQIADDGGAGSGTPAGAIYDMAIEDFDCLGNNVFDFVSSTGGSNWPATLTAVPV